MKDNLERFLRYVKIDTQSNGESESIPSDPKELNLSRLLQKELREMGIESEIDEYGILYGKLEGEKDLEPIGLNSHVDTAEELTGKDVRPRIIENYDGGIIHLNEQYSMSAEEFPTLKAHIGDDLVVTDGNTLLGADDKAGVAIIMAVLSHYVNHPEEKHHTICFAFTPDEEIGRGPKYFDVKKFGAEYAYTVDGGQYNEIAYENFNAAHASIHIQGKEIHPGEAKGKMVNAGSLAALFDTYLPEKARPQFTEGREGFVHLIGLSGDCGNAKLYYIIREHDPKKLEELKACFQSAKEKILAMEPKAQIEIEIKDDYRNMKEVIDKDPHAVDRARKAFGALGYPLEENPIRGGTDGAGFSFQGCPTPNLGTGSYNHHGRYEYLSIQEFDKMFELVKLIVSVDI
ncbi:MAG: peptidase T [Bacilli bacterium]|nr:peptidase T [Bacilli bacterium]